MPVATYDPAAVIVTLGGQLITGFAQGTFVEAAFAANDFKLIHGSEGEVTRTLNLNRSGAIKITLLKTSASNAVLNAFASADRSGGLGIFDVMVKDVSGGAQAHGAKAWIAQPAGFEAGETVGHREWVIQVPVLEISDTAPVTIGSLSQLVESAAQDLYQWAQPFIGG